MERWEQVLAYWFGPDGAGATTSHRWFTRDDAFDAEIRARFGDDYERAVAGQLDDWAITPRGRLALVILLDQFSRNLYRDHADAYAHDARAQRLCTEGIDRGLDRRLSAIERWFFYMPLMHAEDLDLQARSVSCFRQLVEDAPEAHRAACEGALRYAESHRDEIERFGRFPHRNQVLGRTSTPAELRFLDRRER
ncbi:DUF924 family protein [Haliangium sp.]|uniref:DUF924 family protein n=1 Tax=Haliangium sp. TaxID=2663208 RepID=UPI003D13DBED